MVATVAACNCGGAVGGPDTMVDSGLDSGIDVGLDATDAQSERSLWTFDFGPMADVDPAACKPADAWSGGHDTSIAPDGGESPKILWRKVLSNSSTTSYWAGNSTSIIVNVLGHELIAISPKDGAVQWRKPVVFNNKRREVQTIQVSGPSLFFGHVQLGTPPPVVERWQLDNGQGDGLLPLEGPFHPSISTHLNSSLVAFRDGSRAITTSGRLIHRLSEGGKLLWKISTHGDTGPMFVDGRERLIVGVGGEGHKSRIAGYARDGSLLWERPMAMGFARVLPGDRDRVLVLAGPANDMALYAFEGSCGRQLWRVALPNSSYHPHVDVDGAILVYSRVAGLLRISPDGVVLYQKKLDSNFDPQMGPIGADGLLYLPMCPKPSANAQTTFAAIDTKTGQQRFALPLGQDVSCTGTAEPLLYPDGTLYIATRSPNLQVIAVQTNSGGLANSVWPARGGGNRRLYATWPAHDKR